MSMRFLFGQAVIFLLAGASGVIIGSVVHSPTSILLSFMSGAIIGAVGTKINLELNGM